MNDSNGTGMTGESEESMTGSAIQDPLIPESELADKAPEDWPDEVPWPGWNRDGLPPYPDHGVRRKDALSKETDAQPTDPKEFLLPASTDFIKAQRAYIQSKNIQALVDAQTAYIYALSNAARTVNAGYSAEANDLAINWLLKSLTDMGMI